MMGYPNTELLSINNKETQLGTYHGYVILISTSHNPRHTARTK